MATEEMLARREKWAEALESGEYAQTRCALRDDKGYCCLGVACDLYRKENGGRWERHVASTYLFEHMAGVLPDKVARWLGVGSYNGEFEDDALSSRNDAGATFAEIAAIIRAAPEGLFDD